MASEGKIILFDIPTRMLLNYKGLDYQTEWLEYPEIRKRLEGHVPNNGSEPPYTLPAILFPDGTYVMHSRAILVALNERYPARSVPYETPQLERLWPNLIPLMDALEAVFLPRLVRDILSDGSVEYFRRTREADIGMTLEELEVRRGGEVAYDALTTPLRAITAQLGENAEGPFFEGKEIAQVDLVWVGIWLFARRIGDDVFDELMRRSGNQERHLELLEAVKPWTERGDY